MDLIAGLPYQTAGSWSFSLEQAVASGVDHVSVYMLEVDEESRLGREAIAGGVRYHAGALPTDDETADRYEFACQSLGGAGFAQYEISNFARPGYASRHNVKYWQRHPYLGVGLDAHSMLSTADAGPTAIRWANPDDMDTYLAQPGDLFPRLPAATLLRDPSVDRIDLHQAFEESLFLGLRMNTGVDLEQLRMQFGKPRLDETLLTFDDLESAGLLARTATNLCLTAAGRLASNEVFGRLLAA